MVLRPMERMDAMNGPGLVSSKRRLLAAVLCASLLARGGVLLLMRQQLERDPDGYRALATSLVEHGVLGTGNESPRPSAYRPPVYPLLLAPCVALGRWMPLGIALVHLACGVLTVGMTWRLARAWGLSEQAALLAAALVAFDPILLFYSAQVMTETVATLLAVVALDGLTRAFRTQRLTAAAWAGLLAALAALCRPVFLVWLLLAAGAWLGLWFRRRSGNKRAELADHPIENAGGQAASGTPTLRFGAMAAFLGSAALALGPWAVRNAIVFGRPIVTTTHGGYTLLLGNNALYYEHLRLRGWYVPWSADELQRELEARSSAADAVDEVARDRMAYRMALDAIVREPGMFFQACLVRLSRLWGALPLPAGDETALRCALRWLVAAGYAGELLLAAIGLWKLGRRSWRPPWLWGWLMAVGFTAMHLVYWADLRMRAPLVPWLALIVAAAVWPPIADARRKALGYSDL